MIIDDRTALVTRAHRGIGQDEPYAGPLGAPVRPRGRAAATAAALAMTFGIAGAAWVIAVWQMSGMDMGVATRLGSFGSSIGLMVMLVALGVMSFAWMSVIAVVVLAQKVLPAKAAIDVPLALAIVGLGVLIVVAPSSVPGLTPPM
ncbi:MAG: hypothetical protein QOG69_2769 [Actinomycetota bacterium]|nr:hypothetical protein [Actinomycetota bacterium]